MIEGDADTVGRSLEDRRGLLNALGQVAVSYFQRAFVLQRLGSENWPERYPMQTAPKANIAGILSDLNKGSMPAAKRFEARPALQGMGSLITHQVLSDDVVEVGVDPSIAPWASVHQTGGWTSQEVTSTGRRGLWRLLKKRPDLKSTLGFLFRTPVLETRVNRRPFVGVTDELADDLTTILEQEIAHGS